MSDSALVNEEDETIEFPPVHERDARPEDFIGKTVVGFDSSACNVWRFEFHDGSKLAIEADVWGPGLPIMQICVPCGEAPDDDDGTGT